MHKVLILGAGKIGALISGLLAESGDYDVTLADVAASAAESVVKAHGSRALRAVVLDAGDAKALENHFAVHKPQAVISSLPYYCNPVVAKVARKGNAHYFDLTEDVAVTQTVRRLARGATKAFVPQCGLAPGSSALRRTSSPSISTNCGPSSCASAPCPSILTTCSSIR
jgi:saccharopine dehydrogenase-like NADP-dependent oxidoreductase